MQVSEQVEKACPFCGGGDCNTEGRTYSNKGQMFCHDCGASGPHPIYEVATWTSRAALSAAQAVVKPLERVLHNKRGTTYEVSEQVKDRLHPSHETRGSLDASSYDEVCVRCGATDITGGGWGDLKNPCPVPPHSTKETSEC